MNKPAMLINTVHEKPAIKPRAPTQQVVKPASLRTHYHQAPNQRQHAPGRLTMATWFRTHTALTLLMALVIHIHPTRAVAQAPATNEPSGQVSQTDPQRQAIDSAFEQAKKVQVAGPAEITLRDQALFKLPAGYLWVPEAEAAKLLKSMGNRTDSRLLGLVLPKDQRQNWMVVAKHEDAGYIKDDDAKNWDVDALFKSLKEGTEAANEDRKAQGFAELEIVGWVEKPQYEASTHRLVWSMSAKDKGAPAQEGAGINYNTYALGRDGYITLNLLTNPREVEHDKPHARALLSALNYKEGKRYEDYNASTDKTAEYGLAALVGGVAAKKLGLFALAAGFFAKFAKIILLGGIAVLGVLQRIFKRDKA
jgi:uncharacterized membrane-anchored protein